MSHEHEHNNLIFWYLLSANSILWGIFTPEILQRSPNKPKYHLKWDSASMAVVSLSAFEEIVILLLVKTDPLIPTVASAVEVCKASFNF